MIERKKIEVTGTVAGKKVIFQSGFLALQATGCPSSFWGYSGVIHCVNELRTQIGYRLLSSYCGL